MPLSTPCPRIPSLNSDGNNAMVIRGRQATDGSGDYNCDGSDDDVEINQALVEIGMPDE